MKRVVLVFILCCTFSLFAEAQYVRPDNERPAQPTQTQQQQPYNFMDHTSIGGNLSLQFGSITYIVLAPLFNYRFKNYAEIGAGPFYQYYSEQDQYGTFTSSIYGGRAVGMVFLPGSLSRFFIEGEYDVLNVPDFQTYLPNVRTSIGIPLVGAGFRQMAGEKTFFTLALLFDLSNSPLSPYYIAPNTYAPEISAGIDVGL